MAVQLTGQLIQRRVKSLRFFWVWREPMLDIAVGEHDQPCFSGSVVIHPAIATDKKPGVSDIITGFMSEQTRNEDARLARNPKSKHPLLLCAGKTGERMLRRSTGDGCKIAR